MCGAEPQLALHVSQRPHRKERMCSFLKLNGNAFLSAQRTCALHGYRIYLTISDLTSILVIQQQNWLEGVGTNLHIPYAYAKHNTSTFTAFSPWSFLRCSDGRRRLGWFWPLCCSLRTLGCPNVLMWSLWNALREMAKFLLLYGELVWKEAPMTWDIPILWIFALRMDSRALASIIFCFASVQANNLKFYCVQVPFPKFWGWCSMSFGMQSLVRCAYLRFAAILSHGCCLDNFSSYNFTCITSLHVQFIPDFDFNSGHPTLLAAISGMTIWAMQVILSPRLET